MTRRKTGLSRSECAVRGWEGIVSPGVTVTDSLIPVSVAATARTEHDARTQQEVDPRERHPRIDATSTMDALAFLGALIAQPGRHAVLRRELVDDLQRQGKAPASATRALQRRCADGSITRVGAGIYAIGQSRIADIVPEVLPKLGYRILDTPALHNYSIRRSGTLWRLDRSCRRRIARRGIVAVFEDRQGRIQPMPASSRTPLHEMPTAGEIERHLHNFEYCHSKARAEKDLIVCKALMAMEAFEDPDVELAIEGGTALAMYHALTQRFSEDLCIRLVPRPHVAARTAEERIATLKTTGQRFKEHTTGSLPFLKPTGKGRVRKDAIVQVFIFDYRGREHDNNVVPGIKCELVAIPIRWPLREGDALRGGTMHCIDPLETAMGKWEALTTRLPSGADASPNLVRHVIDLATLKPLMDASLERIERMAPELSSLSKDAVEATLRELERPVWREHHAGYLKRMGTRPIAMAPYGYPAWDAVLRRFNAQGHQMLAALTRSRSRVVAPEEVITRGPVPEA